MAKTNNEIILKQFINTYNLYLAKQGINYKYSYKYYIQDIPMASDKEEEEPITKPCTVFEVLKHTKMADDTTELTILYEDYKPNISSTFVQLREKLIGKFINEGLMVMFASLELKADMENGRKSE